MDDIKESRAKEVKQLLDDLKAANDTNKSTPLFNRVSSVLIHDRWFTVEQRSSVVAGAKASLGLTKKQKKLTLPAVRGDDDERYTDEGYNYEGHDDYGSYD